MADFAYSQADLDDAEEIVPSGRLQALINGAGGLVSLVLIAGMIVWGWQLIVRDVSGVPVVEALEDPMRVEPDDPGGREAHHQGLTVNVIAEGQEAAPAADRIVLAPPPVDLAETIAPEPATTPEPGPVVEVAEEAPLTTATDAGAVADTEPTAPTPEAAAAATLDLIDELIAAEEAAAATPSTGQGLTQSLRPIPRPFAPPESAAATAIDAPSPDVTQGSASRPDGSTVVAEVDPLSLAAGTRLVQLGAFDTFDEARVAWDALAIRYPDAFDGRARVLEETVRGGLSFVRLRAHGFDDLTAARRFCNPLVMDQQECIPVTVRER